MTTAERCSGSKPLRLELTAEGKQQLSLFIRLQDNGQ
jgi:hypothetical protein